MKSAKEILQFINEFTLAALERPAMYASSPVALEEILAALDAVRDFAMYGRPGEPAANSYSAYLRQHGFGVASFCNRHFPAHQQTQVECEAFEKLAEFWRHYLQDRPNVKESA